MTDELRIVLVGQAKEAHDKMLAEIRADDRATINSSKLINWIVADYFENFFEKRRKKICKAHLNSRKYLLAVMRGKDPLAIRKALQELARNIEPAKDKNGDDSNRETGAA